MARPEIDPKTPLAQRLRELRRALGDPDREVFAEKIGIPKASVANYERGEAIPNTSVLAAYRQATKVDINWLATGDGSMFDKSASISDVAKQAALARLTPQLEPILKPGVRPISISANDDVLIPRYDIRSAAGAGAEVIGEEAVSQIVVSRAWLRSFLPRWATPATKLGILQNFGDSMVPTIQEDDLIMVAHGPPRKVVAAGGVFIVRHFDDLRTKRIAVDPKTQDLTLISDNPLYPPEPVLANRVDVDLHIVAQVFFAGGRLRNFL